MSQELQECQTSNTQPKGSYAVGKVINLQLDINEMELGRSKSQMANSIDVPATISSPPSAQPIIRAGFDIDTRSCHEPRNPSYFSNIKVTEGGFDLDGYEKELNNLETNYLLQPSSGAAYKNPRYRRQSAYVKSRLPTFGSVKMPSQWPDIEDMPSIPETTSHPRLNNLKSFVEKSNHEHRISNLGSSFQGSIEGFNAPSSQVSDGDHDSVELQVIQENSKLDEQLTDLFKTYCDKFKPFAPTNQRSGVTKAKNTLRKIKGICTTAWLKDDKKTLVGFKQPPLPKRDNSSQGDSSDGERPMGQGLTKHAKSFPKMNCDSSFKASDNSSEGENSADLEMRQEQERVIALTNLNQKINYLANKKGQLQGPILSLRQTVNKIRKEKNELKPTYETYEFQTYEDLEGEMSRLKNSGEYQDNAHDPTHYLVASVAQMSLMAPGLKRYEKLKKMYAENLYQLTEQEYIYRAICEDLDRLRLSEKFLLDSSFEGRGHDLSAGGSVINFGNRFNSSRELPQKNGSKYRQRQGYKNWGAASVSDELSAAGSVSYISRSSNLPLVHVDNFFQRSTSSFNY